MKQKLHTKTKSGKSSADSAFPRFLSAAKETVERYAPWFPWVLALLYFVVMSYFTFRYHRIGLEGVETDFYVELVPQAKKLLAGDFSPLNYGTKGPVYSILLSVMYLIMRDYFYAGLLINLLSAAVFLVVVYFLINKVFNVYTAIIAAFAIAFNYVFQSYTYQAGSDMPFMAMCALSMYFLFKNTGRRDIVFSSLFGLLAFLTRYNGIFIVLGSVVYLTVIGGSWKERLKCAGLWIGVFVLAGLLWFVPNWLATGNPVHNDNYINVMLEFYAIGKGTGSYEKWLDVLPEEFTSLGEIFFYDPVYFIKRIAHNSLTHFLADMTELLGLKLGIFVVPGLILLWFLKADRKKLVYLSFGVFYFLILTLIFYNARFSLYLMVFYIPLAVWPLTGQKIENFIGRLSWVPRAALILVILSYSYLTPKAVLTEIKDSPPFLIYLKELGIALGKTEPDKSKKIIGRKPHVAYFSGLEASMFPEKPKTVGELVEFCHEYNIDYILYSGVEEFFRPDVKILLNVGQKNPGLEMVYYNKFGVIYRVLEEDNG